MRAGREDSKALERPDEVDSGQDNAIVAWWLRCDGRFELRASDVTTGQRGETVLSWQRASSARFVEIVDLSCAMLSWWKALNELNDLTSPYSHDGEGGQMLLTGYLPVDNWTTKAVSETHDEVVLSGAKRPKGHCCYLGVGDQILRLQGGLSRFG